MHSKNFKLFSKIQGNSTSNRCFNFIVSVILPWRQIKLTTPLSRTERTKLRFLAGELDLFIYFFVTTPGITARHFLFGRWSVPLRVKGVRA